MLWSAVRSCTKASVSDFANQMTSIVECSRELFTDKLQVTEAFARKLIGGSGDSMFLFDVYNAINVMAPRGVFKLVIACDDDVTLSPSRDDFDKLFTKMTDEVIECVSNTTGLDLLIVADSFADNIDNSLLGEQIKNDVYVFFFVFLNGDY